MRFEIYAGLEKEFQIKFRETNMDSLVMPILTKVSEVTKINIEDIMGKKRLMHVVFARHLCMYLINKILGIGCLNTSKYFKCHHSTPIHAVRQIKYRLETEEITRQIVKKIEKNLFEKYN